MCVREQPSPLPSRTGIQALLAPPAPASADAGAAGPTEEGGQDVSREAAYNLVRIFRASGNHDLARELTRAFLAM